MKIYSLDERYINYLQKFDSRVCISKLDQAFGRKYVGAVFQINELEYFAPLSSKIHLNNFTDVFIYDDEQKKYIASIKLNNMIPLPKKHKHLLKEVNFEKLALSKNLADRKYGALVEKQYIKLNDVSIKYQILSKAQKFYRSYSFNPKLKLICCDFKMLEEKALEFRLSKDKKKEKVVEQEE